MKLKDYQRLARSFTGTDDKIAQIALAVMATYGFSYDDVDKMKGKRFLYYSERMTAKLSKLSKRSWHMPCMLQIDAEGINLGQFVEVQHFVQMGDAECLPYVAASILKKRGVHREDVVRMANINVRRILGDVKAFLASFEKLIASYSGLFSKDEPELDATEEEQSAYKKSKQLEEHSFLKQYGWQYSVKQVAAFEGITVDQAYALPIIQALNDLAYLKSEADYNKALER